MSDADAIVYELPSWSSASSYPSERLDAITAEAERCDAINAERHDRLVAAVAIVARAIEAGAGYDQYRRRKCKAAVRSMRDALPIYTVWSTVLRNRLGAAADKKAREEREREEAEAERKRQADGDRKALRAVEWLAARGWSVSGGMWVNATGGTPVDSAPIDLADELARDEAIAVAKSGGMIRFSGDDDCEDCAGWDGESRRCECGNRRVGWESQGDFESMHVYGEAW